MSKVAIGIINKDNHDTRTFNSICEYADIIIESCCDDDVRSSYEVSYTSEYTKGNASKVRNEMIDIAREKGAKYLFIINNDIEVVNTDIFGEYIELLTQSGMGLTLYGFAKTHNRIKPTKLPNPCVRLKTKDDGSTVIFNRNVCDAVIGIDLEKNTVRFDEQLSVLDVQGFVQECAFSNLTPFFGFYQDVEKSWEYFSDLSDDTGTFIKTEFEKDKARINESKYAMNADTSVDAVIAYVRDTQSVEKEWRIL